MTSREKLKNAINGNKEYENKEPGKRLIEEAVKEYCEDFAKQCKNASMKRAKEKEEGYHFFNEL